MSKKSDRSRLLKIGVLTIVALLVVGVLVLRESGGGDGGSGAGLKGRIERMGLELRRLVWRTKLRALENGEEGSSESKIDVLKLKLARLKIENEALRRQLEAPLPPDLELIPARVVGVSRFLYIDRGKRSGVAKGDVVLAEEILVGRIVEAGEETAKVRLVSDPETKIPARTARGALGLIVGRENKNLQLRKVLQRDELKEGDMVATSGDGGFPADLLVGKVKRVLNSKQEVYKSADVEPGIEYGKLLYVFVAR